MTNRKFYLSVIAGTSAILILGFQNASIYTGGYGFAVDPDAIARAVAGYSTQPRPSTGLPSTGGVVTTSTPAISKTVFSTSDEYVLVGSQTISYNASDVVSPPPSNATTETDRALTTAYAPYLEYRTQDLKNGDVFVTSSSIEMSHQPTQPISDPKSTATVSAYISCNGKIVSATANKSLKRYYGNHHGAIALNGVCPYQATTSGSVISIQLMAKSSLPQGLIHGKQQTVLIVNQYRLLKNITNPSEAYGAVQAVQSASSDLTVVRNLQNANEKAIYQKIEFNFKQLDLVYITAQATASSSTSPAPMFLYELYGNGARLSYATENVVYNGVSQLSQNIMGMLKISDAGLKKIVTQVNAYRSDDGTRSLKFSGANSQLSALVFRKGLDLSSLYLNKVDLSFSSATKSLIESQEVQLTAPVKLSFKKPELLHLQAFSSVNISGLQTMAQCQMQIVLKSSRGTEIKRSVPSVRSFVSPFDNFTLNSEALVNVESGDYSVTPVVKCSGISRAQSAAVVPASGASLLIQAYGAAN